MNPPHSTRAPQHPVRWHQRAAFPIVALSFFAVQAAIGVAVWQRWWWIAALLTIPASHLMHGLLIGFHEASHGLLRKNRLLNEVDGIIIGIFSLTSFTLFRAVHQTHHAHLATERDEEMWPLVLPSVSRPVRVAAAVLELSLGLFFTPLIFLRSFLRRGSPIRNPRVRRRIWMELTFMASAWTIILTTVGSLELWSYLLWMYAIPAFVAANLQSARKYVEHVGLTGNTVKSLTRSIVAEGWPGRLVALSLLHEPYHGIHHLRGGVPHSALPGFAGDLAPTAPDDQPVYRSYRQAFRNLAASLRNPRAGPQWAGTANGEPG